MTPTTRLKTWATDSPLVVFMVPAERTADYVTMMDTLTINVMNDLKWEPGSVESVGLIAASARAGIDGIFFLEEMGVDPRDITLLMLWGKTYECVGYQGYVSEECGVGTVILPKSGAVLPTLCMPSIDGDWWLDPLHQAYAAATYARLLENGRSELDGSEPYVFVANPATWN